MFLQFRFRLVTALAALLCAASVFAQSPLFGPDGFAFTGEWSCNGHFTDKGVSHAHRVLYEGKTVSDGKWIDLAQKDLEPVGYDADFLMGYDRVKKEIVAFVGDNRGYALLTGQGWQAKSFTLTMTGQAGYEGFSQAKPLPISRVTYKVSSADAFTVTWEVHEDDKWNEDDFLACKRANA
ncbi:MAG: hypothetical protein ABSF53_08980 [Terracidiphilus sp.]|jgi:hypothetical protein